MCVRAAFVLKNYKLIKGLVAHMCFKFHVSKSYVGDVVGEYVLETLRGVHDYHPNRRTDVKTFLYGAIRNKVHDFKEKEERR